MEETWREVRATAGNSPVALLGRGPIVRSGVTGN